MNDSFRELVAIVKRLRDPDGGCPWDLQQTHESLTPYVIEEAYEVVDAIERHPETLPDELGDVLLQVVLHSQIAAERSAFTIDDVARLIGEKLVRRHPHVFGTTTVTGTEEVLSNWEKIKKSEKRASSTPSSTTSSLQDIPPALPALLRAHRIGDKVGRVGFDWNTTAGIIEKIEEELGEFLGASRDLSPNRDHIEEEFGDLLFTIAQLGRKLGLDSEKLLQRASNKFIDRFARLEELAGADLTKFSKPELEEKWQVAKRLVARSQQKE